MFAQNEKPGASGRAYHLSQGRHLSLRDQLVPNLQFLDYSRQLLPQVIDLAHFLLK
jgi:hypothetical protein